MNEDERGRKIRFLVKRRYGDITRLNQVAFAKALNAARKMKEPRLSSQDTRDAIAQALVIAREREYETYDLQTMRLIADHIASLEQLDDEKLDSLFKDTKPRGLLFGMLTDPEDSWTEHERFIEEAFGTAQFQHWASLPHWTVEETVQLTLGLEPGYALRDGSDYHRNPDMALALARRRIVVARSVQAGTLPDPITPSALVDWAKLWSVDVHPDLIAAVIAVKAHRTAIEVIPPVPSSEKEGAEPVEETPPLASRERQTYQRILIGMAVRGYCYDPSSSRSEKPKEIASDIRSLDLEMSDETVRKKLRVSAELLSVAVRNELRS